MTARILYVEDNKMNFLLVKKILSVYDAVVLHAQDGAQAVEIAARELPDLILLDLHLPRLDGFQVAERIRAMEGLSSVPIIAVTASVQEQDKQAAKQARLDGYVEKPVDVKLLCSLIESKLSGLSRKNRS